LRRRTSTRSLCHFFWMNVTDRETTPGVGFEIFNLKNTRNFSI
jgi:hypothetical protein